MFLLHLRFWHDTDECQNQSYETDLAGGQDSFICAKKFAIQQTEICLFILFLTQSDWHMGGLYNKSMCSYFVSSWIWVFRKDKELLKPKALIYYDKFSLFNSLSRYFMSEGIVWSQSNILIVKWTIDQRLRPSCLTSLLQVHWNISLKIRPFNCKNIKKR